MSSHRYLTDTMSTIANVDAIILLGYAFAAVAAISWLWRGNKDPVPALIGSNGLISSYAGAYHYFFHVADVVRDGYIKDPNGVFRVPRPWRWDYVANGTKRIAEICAAPDDVLSFYDGAQESLQADYTMGPEITENPYHQHTVRNTLTRNIARILPEVMDEIILSFEDVLALENAEWKAFTVLPGVMQAIARVSNRAFVGLPLCRNKEYLGLNIGYTIRAFKSGQLIALLPGIFKPLIAPFISPKDKTLRHAMKFLGPLIEERLTKEKELGANWPDKPNDFLSWLLEDAKGSDREPSAIGLRLLVINMAAIHTSSMALSSALFDLTTYPSDFQPMREEADREVKEKGWTKAALANMHKIDSFLRESQRLNGSGASTMTRKVIAKEGFKFSDGTLIPYGAFVTVTGRMVQHDSTNYDHAKMFDGFRFARMREERHNSASEGVFNRHMVSTGPDHLPFGHGKHACPGRFFAATELKAMFAYILVNFDVKAENEGVRPPDYSFGRVTSPNPTAKIWVRKRQ
ncbi:cytochrome P450 [Mycena galericulata]|nr:cytochrome P450 [Mycena galericulata]